MKAVVFFGKLDLSFLVRGDFKFEQLLASKHNLIASGKILFIDSCFSRQTTSPHCFVVDATVFQTHDKNPCLASFPTGSVQGGRHLLGRLGPQDDHPGREGDAWAHVCNR